MNTSPDEYIDEYSATQLQVHRQLKNDFGTGVKLVKASEMNPRPIEWVWKGWLAKGKFHLIGGIAGTGKTTICLSIASAITNGGKFPDGTRATQGEVVIWTGEDDPEDTLTPRLIAMGANLEKIHFVTGNNDGYQEIPFNPATDMDSLSKKLEELDHVRFLIIDPIVSAVSHDSHNNGEVRKDLAPIVEMAKKLNIVIIGITHFSKGTTGREPIERITGSLAFGAVARVVLVASKTKDEEGEDKRILIRAKSNISNDKGGFEYSVDPVETSTGIETTRITWGISIDGSALDLLMQAESDQEVGGQKECMKIIMGLLAFGPAKVNDVIKECIDAGFSKASYRRAKNKLNIKSFKAGFGNGSSWVIEMPKMLNIEQRGSHISVSTLDKNEPLCTDLDTIEEEF